MDLKVKSLSQISLIISNSWFRTMRYCSGYLSALVSSSINSGIILVQSIQSHIPTPTKLQTASTHKSQALIWNLLNFKMQIFKTVFLAALAVVAVFMAMAPIATVEGSTCQCTCGGAGGNLN